MLSFFFRHDPSLHGEASRLVSRVMQDARRAAAGRPVQSAAVIVCASAGNFVRWNPHLHAIFLEGDERLARSMMGWTHSGFGLGISVKILAASSRALEALAQYVARPPISLGKMLVEEHHSSVLYRSEYNPYFKTSARLFPAREFLVQLLQHLPHPRTHLIRRHGL